MYQMHPLFIDWSGAVTDQDPLEILAANRPFAEPLDGPSNEAKAAMLKEIKVRTAAPTTTRAHEPVTERAAKSQGHSEDQTSSRNFRPSGTMPRSNPALDRRRPHRRHTATAAVLALVAIVMSAVAVLAPGPNTDVAEATTALAQTTAAASGRVEVTQTHSPGGQDPIVSTTSFTFDGSNARIETNIADVGAGRTGVIADEVGYLTLVGGVYDGRFIESAIFDRERILGAYAQNLGTLDSLGALFELGDDVSRTTADDGSEIITMRIRVDAGPGERFDDFEAFANLPAGIAISPEGNFDLDVSVTLAEELIRSITYSAQGTRFDPSTERNIAFTTVGSVQFFDLDEPQQIDAPENTVAPPAFDLWVLLNDPARTAYGNFFFADTELSGLCDGFSRDWQALLRPLSPAERQNFDGLRACFDDQQQRSIGQSIQTLLDAAG